MKIVSANFTVPLNNIEKQATSLSHVFVSLMFALMLLFCVCPQTYGKLLAPGSLSSIHSTIPVAASGTNSNAKSSTNSNSVSGAPITFLGFAGATVLSGSMEPEIPKGSLVIVKHVDAAELQIGDDIMFMTAPSTSFTHRIVDIEENWQNTGMRAFKTKGVANARPDDELAVEENVVGKVIFTNYPLGVCVTFIQQNWPLLIFLVVLAIVLYYTVKRINRKPAPSAKTNAQASKAVNSQLAYNSYNTPVQRPSNMQAPRPDFLLTTKPQNNTFRQPSPYTPANLYASRQQNMQRRPAAQTRPHRYVDFNALPTAEYVYSKTSRNNVEVTRESCAQNIYIDESNDYLSYANTQKLPPKYNHDTYNAAPQPAYPRGRWGNNTARRNDNIAPDEDSPCIYMPSDFFNYE